MVGKRGRVRAVAVPMSVKAAVDEWTSPPSLGVRAPSHQQGRGILAGVPERLGSVEHRHRHRAFWTPRSAPPSGMALPEGRRRRRAIKQILGHASILTTDLYLRSGQEIAAAVNDNVGIWIANHSQLRGMTHDNQVFRGLSSRQALNSPIYERRSKNRPQHAA